MNTEDPNRTETVTTRIRFEDLARLDQMASRRGVERDVLIAQAIDALLAQEAWSGGFITPPPPLDIPRPGRLGAWAERRARKIRR